MNPSSADQEGFAKLAFRVPNGKDTAHTVKLETHLPVVASVSPKPVDGWSAETVRTVLETPVSVRGQGVAEVVITITWTADAGTGIAPGEFQELLIDA